MPGSVMSCCWAWAAAAWGRRCCRQTFGSAPEHPELIVLDSTFPDSVRAVTQAIEPARTLFLVSSKSGSTIEPNTFYAHFREQVTQAVGTQRAGGHFAAITDQDTGLARMAARTGFRRAFLNPPDIGGRYSVLSYFGLVPAALIGVDLALLLDRADDMAEACRPGGPVADNPGAWLGACLAAGVDRGPGQAESQDPSAGGGLWAMGGAAAGGELGQRQARAPFPWLANRQIAPHPAAATGWQSA